MSFRRTVDLVLFHNNVCSLFLHQSESLTRTQHEREAEEHKELWEAEVRSRTKLGAKVRFMCFTKQKCYLILSTITYLLFYYFLQIAEMEKRLDEARVEIDEVRRWEFSIYLFLCLCVCLLINLFVPMQEKRKTRKALEIKKVLEAKLEASDQRWV